jgi:hypothetical protein
MHDNSELVRQRGDLLNRELREAKLQVRERGLFKGKLIDKHSSLQDLALSGLRTGDVLSFAGAGGTFGGWRHQEKSSSASATSRIMGGNGLQAVSALIYFDSKNRVY